tara:strand:+ start:92 stop:376 length:285 start_codon:yes stop_codon:yes gene_type:complete
MYRLYVESMNQLGPASFKCFYDEFIELIEDKSLEEFFDTLHGLLRCLRVPLFVSYVLAHPTALKHARRMESRGCARSLRNCKKNGDNCLCKKTK